MVMNTEPELTGPPVIDPSQSVFADSLVSCSAAATDLNDGELTPTYQWENVTMAVNLGAGDSIQLTPSIASIGDEIRCTATATDFDFAERSSTTSVVIENKPPEMTAPTEISPNQNVKTGDDLICNGFGFDIDQSVGLIEGYLWTNNTTNEPLGTTNTYTVDSTNTDVGDVLVCTL